MTRVGTAWLIVMAAAFVQAAVAQGQYATSGLTVSYDPSDPTQGFALDPSGMHTEDQIRRRRVEPARHEGRRSRGPTERRRSGSGRRVGVSHRKAKTEKGGRMCARVYLSSIVFM
jgi:hypothetical protein